MTNETLSDILNNVNKSSYSLDSCACIQISENVDLININEQNCIELNSKTFYDFYLLKNEGQAEKKYTGIILDMTSDLHIFILEEFRGQGHLTSTLNQTILPFLAKYKNREHQLLTFESKEVKEYFINNFDFTENGNLSVTKDISGLCDNFDDEGFAALDLNDIEKSYLVDKLDKAILDIRLINRRLEYQKYKTLDVENRYCSDLYWEMKDEIIYSD